MSNVLRRSNVLKPVLSTVLVALVMSSAPLAGQVAGPAIDIQKLKVFNDNFNGRGTYGTYAGLNGATVSIGGGVLTVQVPDGSNGSGLKVRLPADGPGVRCFGFDMKSIDEAPIGSFMKWTWYGFDDNTGAEVVVLETEIIKTNSFTVRHKKSNGTTVSHHVPDKNWSDVKTKRWDTRRNGTEVQLELEFDDGTKYNSEWMDPPASTIAGFDVITDVPEFSVDSTEGAAVHTEGTETQEVEPVVGVVKTTFPYWIRQVRNADHVVAATVALRGKIEPAFGSDSRRRVRVEYLLDELLAGHLQEERFVVYHALEDGEEPAAFEVGEKLILLLREGLESQVGPVHDKLWDYGHPTGVLPASIHNRNAMIGRINLVHGGQNP